MDDGWGEKKPIEQLVTSSKFLLGWMLIHSFTPGRVTTYGTYSTAVLTNSFYRSVRTVR